MLLINASVDFFPAKSDLPDKKSSLFDLNLAQASLHVNCQKGGGGKYKVLSKLDLEIH